MKAASRKRFVLSEQYAKVPGLVLAYVWHVNDGEEPEILLLNYPDALNVLEQSGHTATATWAKERQWSTEPSKQLQEALLPFKVARGEFRERLATNLSDTHAK